MAAKKNKKTPHGKDSDPRTLPPPALSARVRASLAEGKFQVAIELAKHLLSRLPGDEAKLLLRQANGGRARQLAAKGMFKEAHVVWENMVKVSGFADDLDLHIAWLLNAGEPVQAACFLGKAGDALAASQLAGPIHAQLAALIVAGRDDVAAALPPTSPLVVHYAALASALVAYDQGDHVAFTALLKQIPFRSPYRDVTYILRGLSEWDSAPDKARESFQRPARHSPWAALGRVLAAVLAGADGRTEVIAQLAKGEQALWSEMTGINHRQLRALTEGSHATPADLLSTLLALVPTLGQEESRRLCLDLLPLYPQGLSSVERVFGRLGDFDRQRIMALSAERIKSRSADPFGEWRRVVEILKRDHTREDTPLRIALVYRHMADLAEGAGDFFDDDPASYLWQSLEYDPVDRDTYLALIGQHKRDRKSRQEVVDKALLIFPKDVEFLLLAAEEAMGRNAYKKAVGLAERILAVDPIHVKANNIIVNAGLSHGRKLARMGKHLLAAKEFAAAADRERPGQWSGMPQILGGIHALAHGEPDAGEALLALGQQRIGHGVQAALVTLVEAEQFSLPARLQKRFADGLARAGREAATVVDLLGVIKHLERYGRQELAMEGPWQRLIPYFKRAAELTFTREEIDCLCAYFAERWEYPLLLKYAANAGKQWPQHPRLVYYAIFARQRMAPDRDLTVAEIKRLRDAALLACDQGDAKTMELILRYVDVEEYPTMEPPPVRAGAEENRRAIDAFFAEVLENRAMEQEGDHGLGALDDRPIPEELVRQIKEKTEKMKKNKDKQPWLPF
jgi:tetratricopeptide (TPR) repeat protein